MASTLNQYHDQFMAKVGAKVSAAMNDITKSGNRNLRGFQFSAERIIKSAENLFFQFGGNSAYNDPVGALYKGFSERPGLSNVGNVAAVDVVDININATQQSVLGYISAERGLDKPIDTLWFQGLKAVKANGEYKANDWVNRPYRPMDKAIRNALRGAFAEAKATGTVKLADLSPNGNLLMDTIQITDQDGKTVGKYVDKEIYFNDGKSSAKIENGVITFTGTEDTYKLVVGIDKTSERDGAHTLTTKPATETITVTAQPRRIALQQSFEDNALILKIA